VLTVRARVRTGHNLVPIVPIVIPDLDEVRKFAARLHAERKAWKNEAFGWQAEYTLTRTSRNQKDDSRHSQNHCTKNKNFGG